LFESLLAAPLVTQQPDQFKVLESNHE